MGFFVWLLLAFSEHVSIIQNLPAALTSDGHEQTQTQQRIAVTTPLHSQKGMFRNEYASDTLRLWSVSVGRPTVSTFQLQPLPSSVLALGLNPLLTIDAPLQSHTFQPSPKVNESRGT